jgi:type VII secretion integral membrane protein EccD
MATRFTRVSVRADTRSVDVSLPADRPLVELLPELRNLLSLPPRDAGPWALSTVTAGAIDQRRSLEEAGVVDADVLYLTPPQDAPLPPAIDDVIDEVQATLDNDGSEWTGDARMYGCCALAAVALLALTAVVAFLPLRLAGTAALLADVALCAVIAGWLLRGRGGDLLGAAAIPAWALAGAMAARAAIGDRPAFVAGGLAGTAVGFLALALFGERWHAPAVAGATVVPFGLLGAVLVAAGLRWAAVAAVTAALAVFASGFAPQAALARSRLVALVRAEEQGQQTGREQLATAVRRGQLTLTGAVCGIAVVAAVAAIGLLTHGGWVGVLLGSTLGAVFALRSRAFTRTGQVLAMLLPAVVAATVAALAVPRALDAPVRMATWLAFIGPLLLIAGLILAGRPRMGEVGAARLRQLFDAVELVAVVSLVPLVIVVVGGLDAMR